MIPELHLSDRALQLAAEAAPLPAAVAAHLQTCAHCQAQRAHYQTLFAAAARLPAPAFDFDLAAAVLAQLPAAPVLAPAPAPRAWAGGGWGMAVVLALVVSMLGVFALLLGGALAPLWQSFSGLFGGGLVALAGLLVAGQGLELLAQHRQQVHQLSFL